MRSWKTIAPWLLLLAGYLVAWESAGQDLATIGKGDALAVSGGINVNQVFYHADGIEGRRDPYNYFVSGNLNFSLYGWTAPFSFSLSNQNTSVQQPFNQYGLSPTYKNVTVHLGYRSMTFSKYTLSGHLFLGVGAEVAVSDKVKVAAMYGRLQKAVELDTATSNTPAYRRMGGGVKVTVGSSTHSLDFTVFRAGDDVNSLQLDTSKVSVDPEQNFVVGLSGNTVIFEGLTFKGEVALSALTHDSRAEEVNANNVYDRLSFLFQPQNSSSYYKAMNGTLQYQFKKYSIGLAYERIDPDYATLGAYYFNANLESIALTHTSRWFNQKLNVNARGGFQRDNLDKAETNTMNRLSGSLNLSMQVSPKVMTSFTYSNFSTMVNFRTPDQVLNTLTQYDNLDTLNYQQISQNASLVTNFVMGNSKERRHNLSLNFTYQQTNDNQAGTTPDQTTKYYNINSAYTMALQPLAVAFSLAANANLTSAATGESQIYGPSLSARKAFMQNKVSATVTASYNEARTSGELSSKVLNLRLAANYKLLEKHQFTLNITAVNRMSTQSSSSSYKEYVAQLGYNYNFSVK